MNPFERSVLSMKDFLNQITFRRDSWSHSCSCWMKNNFQLTALWKNHNPRKGFIHAQGFFSCRSLYFFFFFTEPELSYRFHMAPKSTDVYDDISLGFSALFPTCPCTQSLWHLCFCKDRKSVAVSSMENILELHLKETCKRSFICLEKKKKIHRDLTIPVLIHKWYTVFMSQVHITATKSSQQTLRAFAKWNGSFWTGLTAGMTLVPMLPSSWPCRPAFNHSVYLLDSLSPAWLLDDDPERAAGQPAPHTNFQHIVWSSLWKLEGTSPVLPLDI